MPRRRSRDVRIALVGKYVKLEDAYLSVVEALRHAGMHHDCKVEIDWVDSEVGGRAGGRGAAAQRGRDPDPGRVRRPRLRGQDRAPPGSPARSRIPYLGRLPRHARRRQRVRPACRRDGRRQLDRDGPGDAVPGDRPAARAEGDRRHGRHDAARRRPGQAARRRRGSASCTARRSSTSATATVTRSTTTCAGAWRRPG